MRVEAAPVVTQCMVSCVDSGMTMHVRPLIDTDTPDWLRMRLALWPDHTAAEHEAGMLEWRARADTVVFVALRPDRSVCGFVEAGERPYADGCDSSPVGYVEGWYVDGDMRLKGAGRAMLMAAETWARERGRTEMASDALLDNDASHRAHVASGYAEVERLVLFRKAL